MSDVPEYTPRAILFGRMYFAVYGAALVLVGVLMLVFWEAPSKWFGIVAIIAGLAGLIYSVSKPGKGVAQTAAQLVEEVVDD